MDSQVQSAITSCLLCQSNDQTAHTNPAPLQPVPLPDGLWKKLGLDIVGPFDTATPACRYVITLTDYCSKWPELAFSPSATTDDVIQFLSSVFSRHGNPENIVTDNGTQFTSVMFTSFLQNRGISHSRTSVYYPAANGAIERFHRAHLYPDSNPAVKTMEGDCAGLASSLPCNTACNYFPLSL